MCSGCFKCVVKDFFINVDLNCILNHYSVFMCCCFFGQAPDGLLFVTLFHTWSVTILLRVCTFFFPAEDPILVTLSPEKALRIIGKRGKQ